MSNDIVDMTKLTQKELLIRLNDRVEVIGKNTDKMTEAYTNLLVRVSQLELRNKIYASVIAIVFSSLTTLIISFITKK